MNNAGIPTEYRGTTFRSRLEARWARFFDLIGWVWEYEPFDADGYIPDFVIMGKRPLLIEIKPYATLKELISEACRIRPLLYPAWKHQVAVFGIFPFLNIGEYEPSPGVSAYSAGYRLVDNDNDGCCSDSLGWADIQPLQWITCRGLPYNPHNIKCDQVAVHHSYQAWTAVPCGHYDGDGHLGPVNLRDLWPVVRDGTQWHA